MGGDDYVREYLVISLAISSALHRTYAGFRPMICHAFPMIKIPCATPFANSSETSQLPRPPLILEDGGRHGGYLSRASCRSADLAKAV